jgi:LuxR family maltose regulon positive regulatory protein
LVTLGANLTWQGKFDEARDLLAQVVLPRRPPVNNLAALWAHGCLATISARSGDLEAAEQHVERASDLATRHGLSEYAMGAAAVLASSDVARHRGQVEYAEAAARRGLELALRGGARLELAHAHLSLASTLRGGSSREARDHVADARRILATCTAAGALAELFEQFGPIPGPAPCAMPAARREPFEALSKRERTVLQLLSSELSLREIASELFVSYNTVKSQTTAIYRKLGVSNRADAVARARNSNVDSCPHTDDGD